MTAGVCLERIPKRLCNVVVSLSDIDAGYSDALEQVYRIVEEGLDQEVWAETWWGWLMGRREEERKTLSQDINELLSNHNEDGSPNYDAIMAIQAEVLAYDRAPIWKRAWMNVRGQGVEKKRATLLGCEVRLHRRFAGKSRQAFQHYSRRVKGTRSDFSGQMSKDPFDHPDWSFEDQLGKLSWLYDAARSACSDFYDFMCGRVSEKQGRSKLTACDIANVLRVEEDSVKTAIRGSRCGMIIPAEMQAEAYAKMGVSEPEHSALGRELAATIRTAFDMAMVFNRERAHQAETVLKAVSERLDGRLTELEQLKRGLISCLDIIVERCSSLPMSQFELTESRSALLDDLKEQIRSARTGAELASIAEGERYQSVINDWVPAEAAHILQGRLQDLTAAHGGPARGFADTDVMRRAMGLASEGAAAAPEDSAPSAVM